jgi:hypothetical protein
MLSPGELGFKGPFILGVRRALDTNDEAELPIVAAFEVALKIASEYSNQRISMRARDALYSAL